MIMKKTLLLFSFVLFNIALFGQLNMTYISDVSYNEDLNDIWGYVAPDGTEYALVGLRNGVSVVSLADPANPVEVSYLPGLSTTWRDLKTWDQYAYVTNEAGNGVMVIDLTDPNNATSVDYTDLGNGDVLTSIHNIYIDEFGYAYLAGATVNNGGAVILDVFTDPANPAFVAYGNPVYAHDYYARGNILYSSEIYGGELVLYDVSDKNNIIQLGATTTPFNFTHNAWPTDDASIVFTTDEQANAPVAAYDVSDPSDIELLDEFIPIETLGEGVIPHNVHVWNDWLIISYYTDGCILVDGSNPSNLIEVGNFDTFIPASTGFSGAWGAYPFLPSGLVLVSDIGNGLYILEPNYVRACWLEGNVTSANTGEALDGVEVSIAATQANLADSDGFGDYATGLATAGTYDVTFTKEGFFPLTVPATLENGEITILNVELGSPPPATISGQVIDAATGAAIPNAIVSMDGDINDFTGVSDANGNFSIIGHNDEYEILTAAWGYFHDGQDATITNGAGSVTIELTKGYQDDFFADLGWTVQGIVQTGAWERGDPIGTDFQNQLANPENDVPGDYGVEAYVTGNGGGNGGNDDVDNGVTRLVSPQMDLSTYFAPELTFNAWFFNDGGQGAPNDELIISVDNGVTTVVLETIENSTGGWLPESSYILSQHIELTDDMHITFQTGDGQNSGHIVEAAIDVFKVVETATVSNNNIVDASIQLNAFPNPFSEEVSVSYKIEDFQNAKLNIFNALGQQINQLELTQNEGTISLENNLEVGIYIVQIETPTSVSPITKLVKH